jgi:hypothetical protein
MQARFRSIREPGFAVFKKKEVGKVLGDQFYFERLVTQLPSYDRFRL